MDIEKLPAEFRTQMQELLGGDASHFFQSLEQSPVSGVRLNVRKPLNDNLQALFPDFVPVSWCESGIALSSRPSFTLMPELHAGCFYVQEPSSMVHEGVARQVLAEIGKGRPVRVLDLCAAPGGKTTAFINALQEGDLMVANEVVPQRARVLAENLIKWGFPNTVVTSSKTDKLASLKTKFDVVVVDAPCSGEGMMRKEEMALQQWSPSLVAQCAALQREILKDALRCLNPGGYLVYSTCTYNRQENEEQLEWLVSEYGMEALGLKFLDEIGENRVSTAHLKGIGTSLSCYRFMPHLTSGEGLFVALLRKPGMLPTTTNSGKIKVKEKVKISAVDYLNDNYKERSIVNIKPNNYAAISNDHYYAVTEIIKSLPTLYAGVELGELKGKDLVLSPALALSTALNPSSIPVADLSKEEALSFLHRDAITLSTDISKGYVLIRYNHYPIGFVKNLGNRCNNLYPSDWRIRKQLDLL